MKRGTRQKWLADNQGKHFCKCGCGGVIPLRTEHFNEGVPRYLHGHNAKVNPPKPRKPKPAPTLCECGCGGWATPGRRFISGHNSTGRQHSEATRQRLSEAKMGEGNPQFGKRPPNYKGGRFITTGGYVALLKPEHPYATGPGMAYVLEHRLVVEAHLRETNPTSEWLTEVDGVLYLRPGACVHHINGDKQDNRVENLEVMFQSEHVRIHLRERWG